MVMGALGTRVYIFTCVLFLCVAGFTKYSCNGETDIDNCRIIFNNLALDHNTKLIFIHIKNNHVNGTEKEKNPKLEFVWVNKTSLHYLSYPDEFHALSFGLLDEHIYELSIDLLNYTITNFRTDLNITYSNIVSNGTNGYLCHRYFTDQDFRNQSINIGIQIDVANIIWFGFDYMCYDSTDNYSNKSIIYVSKYSSMMLIIATLSVFSMLWFPILLNIVETDNSSMERDRMMKLFQEKFKMNRRFKRRRSSSEMDCDSDTCRTEIKEDTSRTHYNRGDIPYGFHRFRISFFHSKTNFYKKDSCMILTWFLIEFRFLLFISTSFTFCFYFLDRYIHNNLPPDIQEYTTLYTSEIDLNKCFISVVSSLYIYLALIISQKSYLNVIDPASFSLSRKSHCLRKLHLRRFYHNTAGEGLLSQSIIGRFISIFIPRVWVTVLSLSFSGTRQLFKKKRWCCGVFFLWLWCLFVPINIIFHLLTALFPFVWYIFCMYKSLSNAMSLIFFTICTLYRCQRISKTKLRNAFTLFFFIINIYSTTVSFSGLCFIKMRFLHFVLI